jgi:hypothetical protein
MFSKSMNRAISSGIIFFFSSRGRNRAGQDFIMIVQVLGDLPVHPIAKSISYFMSKVERSALYFT